VREADAPLPESWAMYGRKEERRYRRFGYDLAKQRARWLVDHSCQFDIYVIRRTIDG
jgi:hypothetical protein